MSLLVTGANGQLGKEFKYISRNLKLKFIFCSSSELNINDKQNFYLATVNSQKI